MMNIPVEAFWGRPTGGVTNTENVQTSRGQNLSGVHALEAGTDQNVIKPHPEHSTSTATPIPFTCSATTFPLTTSVPLLHSKYLSRLWFARHFLVRGFPAGVWCLLHRTTQDFKLSQKVWAEWTPSARCSAATRILSDFILKLNFELCCCSSVSVSAFWCYCILNTPITAAFDGIRHCPTFTASFLYSRWFG